MDSLEFEYHAALRGEGYVWRPTLTGIAEGPATLIAQALFDRPPDSMVRVWDAQGAEWHFVSLAHSGYRGVRGNAVQLVRCERPAGMPTGQPLDLELEAVLLCALRATPAGALPLSSLLWSILIGQEPRADRLLRLAGRPRPALFLVEAECEVRERLAASSRADALAVHAQELSAGDDARTLVAWAANPEDDEEWAAVRSYLRPHGDEPLLRFVRGQWNAQASTLLAELCRLPRSDDSFGTTQELLRRLREAPALLGCQPLAVEIQLGVPGRTLLHATRGKLVLLLPRPETVGQLAMFKELLRELPSGDALVQDAERELRRAAAQAAPGTVLWWFAKGAPVQRLRGLAEGLLSATETVRILAAMAQPPALTKSEREFLVQRLLDGARGAVSDRTNVWGEPLERAAQLLRSQPLLMLARLNRGNVKSITHFAPELVTKIGRVGERTALHTQWKCPETERADHDK